MINFDNSATTYPKPQSVREAAADAVLNLGGNAGRGGHALAVRTSEAVYSARETAAGFFHAEPENVVFTMNCTHALNMAIQGVMSGGGHLIISSLEHNSAARPAAALARNETITLSAAQISTDDADTVENFRRAMCPDTKAVVCTIASNVTGQLTPYREIAALCRSRGICFIADGAQACGTFDITMDDGIDILCTSGHKGLYGLSGTGLLISNGRFPITPIIQGGTGSASESLRQPELLPEALESGTLNIPGIMSLKAGIEFVSRKGTDAIRAHEEKLCRQFMDGISKCRNVIIYRDTQAKYAPIVSFNIRGIAPGRTAALLSKEGLCLRSGLHCAALAHTHLGTPDGTVRFSPSVFNKPEEVTKLIYVVKSLDLLEN